MCGIAGILTSQAIVADSLGDLCTGMTETLRHRGPDDHGVWQEPGSGVALGHRRLSILDLSPEGRQPMVSACGRYVIVYNGEVYNYVNIREMLEAEGRAPMFRGHSDTEVILGAIAAWGLETAVKQFIGMFAFALWDREERVLHLVRDRLGIKPLYYGWAGDSLLFASELKALEAHPDFEAEISRHALGVYFRLNYIPAPYSIYERVFKLEPGHILTVRQGTAQAGGSTPLPSAPYWSARSIWEKGAQNPWEGSEAEAVDALDDMLRDSIGARLISDVPLGAFLSGGIDSSTVVALMQSLSESSVKTFTIGFYEDSYNEARDAGLVAKHLGTDHTELYVTDDHARAVIPDLPSMYDEPFADSSQIPTFLVSKLAREHVTVILSGDGGDELFSGYSRYEAAVRIWNLRNKLPSILRTPVVELLKRTPEFLLDAFGFPLNPVLVAMGYRPGNIGRRIQWHANLLAERSFLSCYRNLVSHVTCPSQHVLGAEEPETVLSAGTDSEKPFDLYQLMSYVDLVTYLPDDILVKVDRASMAVSLEARVPVLDHRVVEFAARIPSHWKHRNGKSKWLLRRVLNRYVPVALTERPKMGFGVPIDSWLRGPLREWVEELLSEKRLISEGYLDARRVRAVWAEHAEGKRNWAYYLWIVLMFQAWLGHE